MRLPPQPRSELWSHVQFQAWHATGSHEHRVFDFPSRMSWLSSRATPGIVLLCAGNAAWAVFWRASRSAGQLPPTRRHTCTRAHMHAGGKPVPADTGAAGDARHGGTAPRRARRVPPLPAACRASGHGRAVHGAGLPEDVWPLIDAPLLAVLLSRMPLRGRAALYAACGLCIRPAPR